MYQDRGIAWDGRQIILETVLWWKVDSPKRYGKLKMSERDIAEWKESQAGNQKTISLLLSTATTTPPVAAFTVDLLRAEPREKHFGSSPCVWGKDINSVIGSCYVERVRSLNDQRHPATWQIGKVIAPVRLQSPYMNGGRKEPASSAIVLRRVVLKPEPQHHLGTC